MTDASDVMPIGSNSGRERTRARRGGHRRSSLKDLVLFTRSIFMNIKDFVTQSGKVAVAATTLPMLVIVCLRFSIDEVAGEYLEPDRTFIPPIWASTNTTAIPYELSKRSEYHVHSSGSLSPWQMWWNWTVAICLYLAYFLRVVLLHEFSVAAKTAGFIVTIGFIIAHGSIWQKEYEYQAVNGRPSENDPPVFTNPMIAFAFPLIFATTFLVSEGCQSIKKVMKAASILLIFGIFESAAIYVLNTKLFQLFFSSATDALTRFAIRLFTPLVLKGVFLELCAVFAPLLSNLLETEIRPVSIALFAPIGCAADLIGRLFQSSGELHG